MSTRERETITTRGCIDPHHCITCSDEGVPMRVLTIDDTGLARCRDEHGVVTDVMTALVDSLRPGETVLVHAGTALTRIGDVA